MITLILFSQIAFAACINAVPYKGIAQFKLGSEPPKRMVSEKDAPNWGKYQNLRFELDPNGRIKKIQHALRQTECVLISGIQISDKITEKEGRSLFPKCEFESRFGGNSLQCNGFEIFWSHRNKQSHLRIEVSNQDIESIHAERAKQQAERVILEENKSSPRIKN